MLRGRAPQGVSNGNREGGEDSQPNANDNESGSPLALGSISPTSGQPGRTSAPAVSPTSSPSPSSATSSPSPTQTPPPKGGGLQNDPGKLAAIIISICIVLSIPLIYLIWRSHQYKKAIQKRDSQNSQFQEAMLQRPTSMSKGTSQEAAFQALDAQPASTKPHNSLGLFDFDFSPPRTPMTPASKAPSTPNTPGRLSIAHLMPVRRSHASVIQAKRPSTIRVDNPTAETLLEPPLPNGGSRSPNDPPPHLAPLNQIGVAHTSNTRPPLPRSASNQSDSAQRKSVGGRRDSHRNSRRESSAKSRTSQHHSQASSVLLPPIPRGSLHWEQPTGSVPSRHQSVSPLAAARSKSQMTISRDLDGELGFSGTDQRYSAVSSLSDDDHYQDMHQRERLQMSSASAGHRPQQPYHYLG